MVHNCAVLRNEIMWLFRFRNELPIEGFVAVLSTYCYSGWETECIRFSSGATSQKSDRKESSSIRLSAACQWTNSLAIMCVGFGNSLFSRPDSRSACLPMLAITVPCLRLHCLPLSWRTAPVLSWLMGQLRDVVIYSPGSTWDGPADLFGT